MICIKNNLSSGLFCESNGTSGYLGAAGEVHGLSDSHGQVRQPHECYL